MIVKAHGTSDYIDGMLHRLALATTDISEERSASIIKVTGISKLGTQIVLLRIVRLLLVTANVILSTTILVNLMMEALSSSESSTQESQGASLQETAFVTDTAVKTSNPM
jgi:hypothetical protein